MGSTSLGGKAISGPAGLGQFARDAASMSRSAAGLRPASPRLEGSPPGASTAPKPGSMERARSGKLAADKPAGLAAAAAGGLADAPESVCLEKLDGAHITAGLVDALAAGVYRVAFQRGRAHRVRVPGRSLQQLVHQSAAPAPRPHHEADHRPRALVLDMRDRPGVDTGIHTSVARYGAARSDPSGIQGGATR